MNCGTFGCWRFLCVQVGTELKMTVSVFGSGSIVVKVLTIPLCNVLVVRMEVIICTLCNCCLLND
jgi:hypothetical protein